MPRSPQEAGRPWKIVPQGDRSLLLVFGDGISMETGRRCGAAAAALRAADIRGVSDIVPAFNSVAVHYTPQLFSAGASFQRLSDEIEKVLGSSLLQGLAATHERQVDIPVCYGGAHGPDLALVAAHCRLSEAEVVRLHSQSPAYVFMLGFAPGAPYIGVHDPQLAIGRRGTPRTDVPGGSVAIANRQTMIYPDTSPGGWHIIGATPLALFDPFKEPAALLTPGDTVRFVPIGPDEFLAARRERP